MTCQIPEGVWYKLKNMSECVSVFSSVLAQEYPLLSASDFFMFTLTVIFDVFSINVTKPEIHLTLSDTRHQEEVSSFC